jgi:hypothetical protein
MQDDLHGHRYVIAKKSNVRFDFADVGLGLFAFSAEILLSVEDNNINATDAGAARCRVT